MFLFHLAFIPSPRLQNCKHGFAALFFAVLLAAVTPLCAAEKSNIVPCNIKLVFGVDDNGMSVVSYDLEMQINNQQGRTIHGVSVHWLNSQAEVIGNSDATCGVENTGVKLDNLVHAVAQFKKLVGVCSNSLGKTRGPAFLTLRCIILRTCDTAPLSVIDLVSQRSTATDDVSITLCPIY